MSTASASGGANSSMPVELSQMMDAFRQLQPPPPPPPPPPPEDTRTDQSLGEGGEERDVRKEEDGGDNEISQLNLSKDVAKLLDERLLELETRLRNYVDSKLANLEKQLLSKFNNLSERIDVLNQTHQLDAISGHCEVSNGGIALSEDPQLD